MATQLCQLCDTERHAPREFEAGWCHACGRPLDHAIAYGAFTDPEPLLRLEADIERKRMEFRQDAAKRGMDIRTYLETVVQPMLNPEWPVIRQRLREGWRVIRRCVGAVSPTSCPAYRFPALAVQQN